MPGTARSSIGRNLGGDRTVRYFKKSRNRLEKLPTSPIVIDNSVCRRLFLYLESTAAIMQRFERFVFLQVGGGVTSKGLSQRSSRKSVRRKPGGRGAGQPLRSLPKLF